MSKPVVQLSPSINRILYVSFLLVGMYFTFLKHQHIEAASFIGIALIFDPFDQKINWKNRLLWQKALLLAHLLFLCSIILVSFL
jgi:hypothetical protein